MSPSLPIFAALLGIGGSLISLLMSKWIAKMLVSAQVIEQPKMQTKRWLVEAVRKRAQAGEYKGARSRALRTAGTECFFLPALTATRRWLQSSAGLLHRRKIRARVFRRHPDRDSAVI